LIVGWSSADGPGREHHDADGDDDRNDHDSDMVGQADRRDHRIQREHNVDEPNLDDRANEARVLDLVALASRSLETMVNLERRFREQEQAAADQNQVAARDVDVEHAEQRLLQPHDPRQEQQQQDARAHREAEAKEPRALPLRLGQAPDENADEDDVVDAENDLEQRQRRKRNPRFWRSDPLHRGSGLLERSVGVVQHLRERRGRQVAA
jgi:hypothetical protein